MKNIISAVQTRAADTFTIENEPISSIDLMERASRAFIEKFVAWFGPGSMIHVVCGVGNNGGDGFAIARLLVEKGYSVKTSLITYAEKLSEDCKINFDRLGQSNINVVKSIDEFEVSGEVVIDAIFGSGLNRPVTGLACEVIQKINKASVYVVSVDIPSGLFADQINLEGEVVEADCTISFQRPKLTFLIPESGKFVGAWYAVDIGLDEAFLRGQQTHFYLVEGHDIAAILPERKKFQHKGNFGRVQVFSGSHGKIGAALLCSKAVLRSGAGLLTTHIPQSGYEIMQVGLPEAMVTVDEGINYIKSGNVLSNTDVVCIGPGIGTESTTARWLDNILENTALPMVLDADALNVIAQDPRLMNLIPPGSVLTPHMGEFHRLFGECESGLERIEKMRSVALERKLVILLKGAHSTIALPDGRVVFNSTGNAGMATAGSGDVLSGIITGLLAQRADSGDAAMAGVYLHGLAGDLAEKKVGKMSLMASDLLNELPEAINNVQEMSFIGKNFNFI